jgi:hypothetical protein
MIEGVQKSSAKTMVEAAVRVRPWEQAVILKIAIRMLSSP